MSWPEKHEGKVRCIDFPEKYFPAIKQAIDNEMVTWGKSTLFMYLGTAEFEWAGCTWELEEEQECVISIRLVKGKPREEDLTAAMLKGKIETS